MLLNDLTKRCEICYLSFKIRRHKRNIESIRKDLVGRNVKYHNGRLEVDDMMDIACKQDRVEIYNLKKEIVKRR